MCVCVAKACMCVELPILSVVFSQDQCLTRSDMWRITCSLVSLSLSPCSTAFLFYIAHSFPPSFPSSLSTSFLSLCFPPPFLPDRQVCVHSYEARVCWHAHTGVRPLVTREKCLLWCCCQDNQGTLTKTCVSIPGWPGNETRN